MRMRGQNRTICPRGFVVVVGREMPNNVPALRDLPIISRREPEKRRGRLCRPPLDGGPRHNGHAPSSATNAGYVGHPAAGDSDHVASWTARQPDATGVWAQSVSCNLCDQIRQDRVRDGRLARSRQVVHQSQAQPVHRLLFRDTDEGVQRWRLSTQGVLRQLSICRIF